MSSARRGCIALLRMHATSRAVVALRHYSNVDVTSAPSSSSTATTRLHGMAAVPLNPVQKHRSRGMPMPDDEVQSMVEQVEKLAKEAGEQVHIRIWNAILKACCTHERFDLALDVYYPQLAKFGVRPTSHTYLTIINSMGTSNVYERAVDFVYKLRAARVPLTDSFFRSIMSTAARRGDMRGFTKYCRDLIADKVPMTESTCFLAVREFSRAHMINELRLAMAYYYDCGGQLTPDMAFPVLRAEYEAGNVNEARSILSSLSGEFLTPKLVALLIPLEFRLGADSLWAFFELVIHLNAYDPRCITVFASNFHRLGNYELAIEAMMRGATLGLIFDSFSAQLTSTFLVEHQLPRGVVRVPLSDSDGEFVDNYLLALPDEQLFDAKFHMARARESVDTSLPLVVKAYQVLCCTGDADRAAKPITGQSDTTITSFTDITATTFLGTYRIMAMLHGYANAWHFAWFMLAGVRHLDTSLAFYALIEMLPKLSYGTTMRQRFAKNRLVQPPPLTEPCKRCRQPGHLVQFCGTASDKAYDKVPSHYSCRLCGERHQIYNCPKYVPKGSVNN